MPTWPFSLYLYTLTKIPTWLFSLNSTYTPWKNCLPDCSIYNSTYTPWKKLPICLIYDSTYTPWKKCLPDSSVYSSTYTPWKLGTTMTDHLVAAVVPSIHHLILCYSLWLSLSWTMTYSQLLALLLLISQEERSSLVLKARFSPFHQWCHFPSVCHSSLSFVKLKYKHISLLVSMEILILTVCIMMVDANRNTDINISIK